MTPSADDGAAAATESVSTDKSALRRALLAARRQTDRVDEHCVALLAIPEVRVARVVAAYSALRGEPDLGPALAALQARGVRVLLPAVKPDRDLEFHDQAGERTPLNAADVVFVPAVAADRTGGRLGRGGGSYDRALRRSRADALVIAVVHPPELLEAVPVEAHDLRVGAILAGAQLVRVPPATPR
jgi:5-formyltetrahydrofolate cyclo-ligase